MSTIDIESLRPVSQGEAVSIPFKLHTIIVLVGPDGAGKTRFVMEQLMLQLKMAQTGNKKISISYASIDHISRELLDNQMAQEYSQEMIQVADQAQDVLLNKVKNATSYPVNADFVIVDTAKALDSDFRAMILDIATQNHYNVSALIFNIKSVAGAPGQQKDLRRVISGGISKKEYESVHMINSKEFDKYQIIVDDYVQYDQYILPEGPEYVVIGDIHGCLDEFLILLQGHGFIIGEEMKVSHPENKRVVLVGDIVDKGYAIKEVIEFVYCNLDTFHMVIGNHENFIYKVLKGIIKKGDTPHRIVLDEYFNTLPLLKEHVQPKELKEKVGPLTIEDAEKIQEYEEQLAEYERFVELPEEEKQERAELREKFFKIYESMKAFLIHKDFIVTHAPCEKKYLGKISADALKAARDFRYPKKKDYEHFSEFIFAFDEMVAFLKNESSNFHPLHIFGHVMTREVTKFKNKLPIDTGCVAGGKLTSVTIKNEGRKKVEVISIPAIDDVRIHKAELYNFFEETREVK